MEKKEKDFLKKVNIDKAKNKTIPLAVLMVIIILFDIVIILIEVIPPWDGDFNDYGIVFEITSLVLICIAMFSMKRYNETRAKIYIICSMILIGWILIYECMVFYPILVELENYRRPFREIRIFLSKETMWIIYIFGLLIVNKYLSKANNPIKHKESTDWFYETYEENEYKDDEIK